MSDDTHYADSFLSLTILMVVTMIASMIQLWFESFIHSGFVNVGFLLVFTGVPWFIFGVMSMIQVFARKCGIK